MQYPFNSNKVDIRMSISNKLVTALTCACLIFLQSAFAARMGSGKSYGMQRSISSKSSQQQSYQQQPYQQQPYQQQPAQQARPGMGAGTAGMLGAAAGAAGGYMLGRSMSNNGNMNNASGTSMQAEHSQSNIPWGTIGILGILLLLGLMMFRKSKANPGFSGSSNTNINSGQPSNPGMFKIPGLNRNNSIQNPASTSGYYQQQPPMQATNGTTTVDKMPDGVETMYFLRQVKGTFLHIQSMNNPDNVNEVEKYMTPNLYQEIKSTISANSFVADFSNLDCQLLECEANQGQLIASVKFFGMVSDEPNQPAHPFSEIWNFVKPDIQVNKWLVAGIQQETLA